MNTEAPETGPMTEITEHGCIVITNIYTTLFGVVVEEIVLKSVPKPINEADPT